MRKSSRTLSARIHRINGQLQAIERMLNAKRPCSDVLNQIGAIRAGLEEVAGLVFQTELSKRLAKRRLTEKDLYELTKSFSKTT